MSDQKPFFPAPPAARPRVPFELSLGIPADSGARDEALARIFGKPRGDDIALPTADLVMRLLGQPVDPFWLMMGVQIFETGGGVTTYCTAGLSNPLEQPLHPGKSGFGYELCMESKDENWAIESLMTLLFYQLGVALGGRPGRRFEQGQWIPLRPALPVPETTRMRALAVTPHPASPVKCQSGEIALLQLVGMTKRELAWLVGQSIPVDVYVKRLMREVGRVTDLARPDMDVPDVDMPGSIAKYCV